MEPVCKIWLQGKNKAFGEGPCKLLKNVDELGSLHQAAQDMNMSYSKAWSIIKTAEKELGFSLIERKKGGLGGGGSSLTPKAKTLIALFTKFNQEAQDTLIKLYKKHFEGFI